MNKILAGLLAGSITATAASAAPRAESALECGIAADMAVVAHALSLEAIDRPKAAAIMARIYDVSESERGMDLMQHIVDAAYVRNGASAGSTAAGTGQKFAEDLFTTCMKSGGNMEAVLGKPT